MVMIKLPIGDYMNIYFSCSITGGREDQQIYEKIVDFLIKEGHDVPTAHLASIDILADESIMNAADVYHRDLDWVSKCDVLIAEVSTPSHGVGYEIAAAIFQGKKVMCCHHKDKKISKIISGNTSENMYIFAYGNEDQLIAEIGNFLK
ncbi:MAG: nucleoside 2-deoxyribosyltransferase [Candidatus Desulfaltia sp.]|nr:nucleoside 2-deoxyribosyltransferase [Candidatus Desulfaltia sp.]